MAYAAASWFVKRGDMPPKVSYVTLTPDQRRELEELARKPGWRILPQERLPSVFSPAMRQKLDSALLVASGTGDGSTYLVCNAFRVDVKAQAIDQEPFAVIVTTSGSSATGAFVHHGNWPGRTQSPPAGFWDYVTASGVGNYFFAAPPTGQIVGELQDLSAGQRKAFDAVIRRIGL
jgi:hypothetical protein